MVKLGVGDFLILHSAGVALLRTDFRVEFGNAWSDGTIGFAGGVLGGIAGLSGALPTACSLVRGWDPRTQRAVYQSFTAAGTIAWRAFEGPDKLPPGVRSVINRFASRTELRSRA